MLGSRACPGINLAYLKMGIILSGLVWGLSGDWLVRGGVGEGFGVEVVVAKAGVVG